MALEFVPVSTEEDIQNVAKLAEDIWREIWTEILGEAQTEYMLEIFQSPEVITRDIQTRCHVYWLLREGDEVVGYIACAKEIQNALSSDDPASGPWIHHSKEVDAHYTRRLYITKIYLTPEARGRRYSAQIFEHFDHYAQTFDAEVMYLQVSRENNPAVQAYAKNGFDVVQFQDNPIGNGFYLSTYVMLKAVTGKHLHYENDEAPSVI